jgi:type IV pilus assembly protein PilB
MARKKLGDLLREARVIDDAQLASALGHQRQWGGRLGSILVQLNMVKESDLTEAISRQLSLPSLDIAATSVPVDVLTLIPQELCEKHLLLPWARTRTERGAETLHVAMSDPTNLAVVDELAFRTGKRIEVSVAADRDVELAIRRYFYGERIEDQTARRIDVATAAFGGSEVDLHPGEGGPLELASRALDRTEAGPTPVVGEATAEQRMPARQPVVYGGIERTPVHPLPTAPAPLSLRERMLLQTLEAELGAEGLDDRQLLLALARLLIRKGVIGENEWIEELERR